MQYRYVAPSPLRGAKNVLPLNLMALTTGADLETPNLLSTVFLASLSGFLPTSCAYTRGKGNDTMKLFTMPFENRRRTCGKALESIY